MKDIFSEVRSSLVSTTYALRIPKGIDGVRRGADVLCRAASI